MPLKFTVGAGPNTMWRIRVIVHPTQRALIKARGSDCLAFFKYQGFKRAFADEECVYGEIHLSLGANMRVEFIAHETYHALIEFARLTKLKIHEADYDGEELAACAMEHMVENILWMLKKKRVKVL